MKQYRNKQTGEIIEGKLIIHKIKAYNLYKIELSTKNYQEFFKTMNHFNIAYEIIKCSKCDYEPDFCICGGIAHG